MPNGNLILMLLLIGGLLLLVLFNEAVRKLAAFLIVISLAFSLGWFWPKARSELRLSEAQAASPPCVSSH